MLGWRLVTRFGAFRPRGALVDPALQSRDLFRLERRAVERHARFPAPALDALDQAAFFTRSRHDDRAADAAPHGPRFDVEPQLRFGLRPAVAAIAGGAQDGFHVSRVIDCAVPAVRLGTESIQAAISAIGSAGRAAPAGGIRTLASADAIL